MTTEKRSFHGSETAQRAKHEVVHNTAHQKLLQLHKITDILKRFVIQKEETTLTQRPTDATTQALQ